MKNNMGDIINQQFDIPKGAASRSAHIELFSNRRAIIDGCYGVIDYQKDAVQINCGNGTVLFLGNDLEIISYFDKGLVLEGKISAMEFIM